MKFKKVLREMNPRRNLLTKDNRFLKFNYEGAFADERFILYMNGVEEAYQKRFKAK
jgi:hypothetical protein